ncbi:MAG: MBOAT family protein [Rickettsiales bacterium]|nr:MBOAT family protein [Rickettsiales bacterium]
MVFSSSIFLSIFLPLFLCVYYLASASWRSRVILIGSYTFYAWWRVDFVALFAAVTYFAYAVSLRMEATDDIRLKQRWLTFGVIANLLTLGYFKYFNFGVQSFNILLAEFGIGPWQFAHVILPIGISFYVFHTISYLVDIYRKDAPLPRSFWDFAAFVALFPHLIAGPVLRYKNLAEQFAHRQHSWALFNEGAIRFALGFCKKVLIADSLAPLADVMFAQTHPTLVESWLGILAYTAQLYFDFSGYSDMAIGLALMMGFRFLENFRHPYLSRSITEFWRRWHISLSNWLRDYLYIPLGGNRKGRRRTYINLFLTMLLGGLWHGANITFVLWGAWHGFWLAFERWRSEKTGTNPAHVSPYPSVIALPLTALFVIIGWVLFRAPDIHVAMDLYAGLLGQHGYAIRDSVGWQVDNFERSMLLIGWLLMFVSPWMQQRLGGDDSVRWAGAMRWPLQTVVCLLFMMAICKMIAQSFSPFLYFQF